jgi:hypothetical protein
MQPFPFDVLTLMLSQGWQRPNQVQHSFVGVLNGEETSPCDDAQCRARAVLIRGIACS